MGHLTVVKELLDKEKKFSWPVGIRCDRKPHNCAAYQWDKKCMGPACPYKQ